MEERTCEVEDCDRRSCMPTPYPAQCAKHYLAAVDKANKEAAARFRAHLEELLRKKNSA